MSVTSEPDTYVNPIERSPVCFSAEPGFHSWPTPKRAPQGSSSSFQSSPALQPPPDVVSTPKPSHVWPERPERPSTTRVAGDTIMRAERPPDHSLPRVASNPYVVSPTARCC